MSPLSGALFDFDGTIFRFEDIHHEAVRQVVAEYTGDQNIDIDELRAYTGLVYEERIQHMLVMRGIHDEPLIQELTKKAELIRRANETNIEELLVPGVGEMIMHLFEAGVPLAVVSSAPHAAIEHSLNKTDLLKYFQRITGGDDVDHRKPHPEPYQLTMDSLDMDSELCIAFEDSPAGIESAQLAGLKVVGIKTTFSEHDLDNAEHVINDFTEITLEHIEAMFR